LTCSSTSENKAPNGVCYGCSVHCHDNHDLVELYTKRKFSCDCGNSKFPTKCTLFENKLALNVDNKYNHNFNGNYCLCKKRYPEEETGEAGPMVQCAGCEDWFHLKHIADGTTTVTEDNVDDAENEMFCKKCVSNLRFLLFYASGKPVKDENGKCLYKDDESIASKTLFFEHYAWRESLCRCDSCQNMYEDLNCTFLLEMDDRMDVYMAHCKAKIPPSQQEKKTDAELITDIIGEHHLDASVSRDVAMRVMQGMNEFRSAIDERFNEIARIGGVVTADDVKQILAKLNSSRKRKANDNVEDDDENEVPE